MSKQKINKILLFSLLFICILGIIFFRKEHLTDLDKIEIQKQIDINLMNYNDFMKERLEMDNLLKKYNEEKDENIEYGYGLLKETDKNSLGFCQIGEYYNTPKNSKFENKPENLKNCKKCKDCLEKPGYYLSNGCLGDKNSQCTFGSLPNEIYLKVHEDNSVFHNGVYPQHQHTLEDGTLSAINHTH